MSHAQKCIDHQVRNEVCRNSKADRLCLHPLCTGCSLLWREKLTFLSHEHFQRLSSHSLYLYFFPGRFIALSTRNPSRCTKYPIPLGKLPATSYLPLSVARLFLEQHRHLYCRSLTLSLMESKIASKCQTSLLADPLRQGVVGFTWVAAGDDRMKDGWVLNDLRHGCIDLRVRRGGRVIFP